MVFFFFRCSGFCFCVCAGGDVPEAVHGFPPRAAPGVRVDIPPPTREDASAHGSAHTPDPRGWCVRHSGGATPDRCWRRGAEHILQEHPWAFPVGIPDSPRQPEQSRDIPVLTPRIRDLEGEWKWTSQSCAHLRKWPGWSLQQGQESSSECPEASTHLDGRCESWSSFYFPSIRSSIHL